MMSNADDLKVSVAIFGLQTHRTQVSGHRHQDISALRHFGPSAETVRTIGPDTSVPGPGDFGTSAEVSSYCDRTVGSCRDSELTVEALQAYKMIDTLERVLYFYE